MRIVFEQDTPTTTSLVAPSAAAAAAAPAEAEDAGPPGSGVETTSGADAGSPPQWLLEAVGRAMDAENADVEITTDTADGGPAPNEAAAATELPARRAPRGRKP